MSHGDIYVPLTFFKYCTPSGKDKSRNRMNSDGQEKDRRKLKDQNAKDLKFLNMINFVFLSTHKVIR